MYTKEELDSFLLNTIIPRGLHIDLEDGFDHTHNKADEDAQKVPFKFILCTPELRDTGRMSRHDMVRMASFIGELVTRHRPLVMAGVPNVGQQIALDAQAHIRETGLYIPCMYLTKDASGEMDIGNNAGCESGEVGFLDDVVHMSLSKQRTMRAFRRYGYSVKKLFVFLDYDKGAREFFESLGLDFYSVSTVRYVFDLGKRHTKISCSDYHACMTYLEQSPRVPVLL